MTQEDINARLIILYKEISDHTQVPCSGKGTSPCRLPHSCCDASVCDLTIEQAKWDWNTTLPRTNHPRFPLMAPDGSCTAPPHMRPLCAMHCCIISSLGFDPKNPEWTVRYFELRTEIDELEMQKRASS